MEQSANSGGAMTACKECANYDTGYCNASVREIVPPSWSHVHGKPMGGYTVYDYASRINTGPGDCKLFVLKERHAITMPVKGSLWQRINNCFAVGGRYR